VLNCALKVFPFILVIFVYVNLKKKIKKKINLSHLFLSSFLQNFKSGLVIERTNQTAALKLLSNAKIFFVYAGSSILEFRHHSIRSRD
jgi:hypothetical protein